VYKSTIEDGKVLVLNDTRAKLKQTPVDLFFYGGLSKWNRTFRKFRGCVQPRKAAPEKKKT